MATEAETERYHDQVVGQLLLKPNSGGWAMQVPGRGWVSLGGRGGGSGQQWALRAAALVCQVKHSDGSWH